MTGDESNDTPHFDGDGILITPTEQHQDDGSTRGDPRDTYQTRVRDHPDTKRTQGCLSVWAPMGVPLWEQMPHEPDEYYALFSIYRDLPPKKRSLAEAGRHADRTEDWMQRLALRFAWGARANACDQERALQRQVTSVVGGGDPLDIGFGARQQALASMPTYRERATQRLHRHVEQKYVAGSVITNLFYERVLRAAGIVRDEHTGEWVHDPARVQPLDIKDKDWPAWARLGNEMVTQAMESMGVPLSLVAPTLEDPSKGDKSPDGAENQEEPAPAVLELPVGASADLSTIPTDQLKSALESFRRSRSAAE